MTTRKNLLLLLLALFTQGQALAPIGTRFSVPSNPSLYFQPPVFEDPPVVPMVEPERASREWIGSRTASTCAGLITGLCGLVVRSMAEDMEYAELPPPYVPALFGVVLIAGIGVLTASLGDVMTEGKCGSATQTASYRYTEKVVSFTLVIWLQRQTWDYSLEHEPRRKSNEVVRRTSSVGKLRAHSSYF
jgi:hypothetical protein